MSYVDYLVRRAIHSVPVIFGLSVLIFLISRVIPGDPVRLALGPEATQQQVAALRAEMGLDQPLPMQYVDWLVGVVQGDWGMSLRTNNNVFSDIVARLPATLELTVVTLFCAVLLAIPFGVVAGTNKDRWQDHLSRITALFGVSMPRFWVAIVLQIVFVVSLGLLPLSGRLSDGVAPPPAVTGLYLVDSLIAGQFGTFLDAATHLLLPTVALGLATLAQVMRLIRSDMIDEQRKDYVLAARAYGLPNTLIEYKYMLQNAFTSSLTVVGLAFGFLLGNAFLVEIVFAWPGMARYGVQAILYQDFNAIVGVTIVVGIGFVTANFVVDLLYGYLDPRVRLEEG
ncbi:MULTISPECIES: ABC transporter permease [Haloferax]|jgi:peptide/nickel transport system permease protein|uniref:ABC transporter permease n=4 Tax=Haloferax TaxID=2251 RepID=A0A6C0UYB0_HALVO|nr:MULTISPECIES: ABC transporter permease [Haloferax]ELK55995.1 putative dipeptides/oligopeptides ABC transporter permease [Haloferax sp. BAB-2207]ELZ57111.1 putative dipeptides/oligopeptides ABC transporter permease [Haloferax sp. ATCC BAA-646]ELZ68479.1 putative dipeptides/oligopeptides ABC transporter permease [Haloferax sp. ATCC BAA-645]ELZ68810.1 putative dipeptides/oligopeptides ABC transporter permease [Haloferax sp. ATCC BAA-644]ELZ74932.1 putative dipeptides/oligopeptides ABC transpor